MLITFSGIDGTGKSTQAKFAAQWLTQREYDVHLIHLTQWTLVYRLGQWLVNGEKTVSDKFVKGSDPANTFVHSAYSLVRQLVSLIDIFRFHLYLTYYRRKPRSVLICDRYFFDLAIHALYIGVMGERTARIYWQLAPQPQMAILFSVDPETAQQREGDHALSYYVRKQLLYKRYANVWPVQLLPANDLVETQQRLMTLLSKLVMSDDE